MIYQCILLRDTTYWYDPPSRQLKCSVTNGPQWSVPKRAEMGLGIAIHKCHKITRYETTQTQTCLGSFGLLLIVVVSNPDVIDI